MIKSKTKTFLNHFIVAYFTLNREIKKRRGRKNSRIPREKIEESLRRKINHMDAHPAVIDSNVSLANRESIWRLRKREKERRNYQRHSEDAAETSEQDDRGWKRCCEASVVLLVQERRTPAENRAQRNRLCRPFLPSPLFVWPAVHKSSALDKSRKKMKGIN